MIHRTLLKRQSRLPLPEWALPGEGAMRQALQILILILLVGLITFVLYLYVLPTSQMSEARTRIAELKAQKAALNRERAELAREISLYSDLTTLEYRARRLGMGPPVNAVFLNVRATQQQPAAQAAVQAGAMGQNTNRPVIGDSLPFRTNLDRWLAATLEGGESALDWVRARLAEFANWVQRRLTANGV